MLARVAALVALVSVVACGGSGSPAPLPGGLVPQPSEDGVGAEPPAPPPSTPGFRPPASQPTLTEEQARARCAELAGAPPVVPMPDAPALEAVLEGAWLACSGVDAFAPELEASSGLEVVQGTAYALVRDEDAGGYRSVSCLECGAPVQVSDGARFTLGSVALKASYVFARSAHVARVDDPSVATYLVRVR